MNDVQQHTIASIFRENPDMSKRLLLLVVVLLGLFFCSAAIFIFLRSVGILLSASDVTLISVLHVGAMILPPLMIGLAILYLRRVALYLIAAHISLVILVMFPLWYLNLGHVILSTLVNNLVFVIAFVVLKTFSVKLRASKYDVLLVVLYVLLLSSTSGFQIVTRLQLQ